MGVIPEARTQTRGQIARKALREAGLAAAGWAAGALVLWRFGQGRLADDAGLILVAVAVTFAVAVVLSSASKRQLPRWRGFRWGQPDLRWNIASLLIYPTFLAVWHATDAYDTTSALEVWAVIGLLMPVAFVAQYGPPLVRPEGFPHLRRSDQAPVGAVVLLAGLFVAAIVAWWIANQIIAEAQFVPMVFPSELIRRNVELVQPSSPLILPGSWVLVVGVPVVGFVLWLAEMPRGFYLLAGVIYLGLLFWSEEVWALVQEGRLILRSPGSELLLLQVVSGVLFLAALLTGYFFRPLPDTTLSG